MDAIQNSRKWQHHQCRQTNPIPQNQSYAKQRRQVSKVCRMPDYLVNSLLYYLVLFNNRYFSRELLLKRGDCHKPDCYTKGDEQTTQVTQKRK